MLTLPSDTECATYAENTGITTLARYMAVHGCEWDDYVCCFNPDDSCELVCSRAGSGWENLLLDIGMGSCLGLVLLCCFCISTCRWRY